MSTQYSPKVVTDGLIMALDATNSKSYTSGSLIWGNLANSPYSGSLVGATTYVSNSFYVSGSTSYIGTNYFTPSPSLSATTYEITFKPFGPINNYSGLIGYSVYLGSGFSIGMFPNYLVSQGFSGSATFYDTVNIDPSTINIITAVFENRANTYYVNGVLALKSTYAFDVITSFIPMRIGNQTQGGWINNMCNIYSTKIYNKALSAQEVLQNYNAQKSRYGL